MWIPDSITTSNYLILTANTYSVEVTTNGCTGSDSIVVDYTAADIYIYLAMTPFYV